MMTSASRCNISTILAFVGAAVAGGMPDHGSRRRASISASGTTPMDLPVARSSSAMVSSDQPASRGAVGVDAEGVHADSSSS